MMRAVLLAVVPLAATASAQVTGACGPGRSCTVRELYSDKVCFEGTNMSVGHVANTSNIDFRAYPGRRCSGTGASMLNLNVNGTSYLRSSLTSEVSTSATNGVVCSTAGGDGCYSRQPFGTGASGNGAPLASFPTCTASLLGRMMFDSTYSVWRYCTGTTWEPVARNGVQSSVWTAHATMASTAAPEGAHFFGVYQTPADRTAPRAGLIACQWETAGSGGSVGIAVEVWDFSAGAQLCNCVVSGSCGSAARVPQTCYCGGQMAPERIYTVRLTSATDCATNPSGMTCSVQLMTP